MKKDGFDNFPIHYKGEVIPFSEFEQIIREENGGKFPTHSFKRIADLLGVKKSIVKNIYYSAVKKLKESDDLKEIVKNFKR